MRRKRKQIMKALPLEETPTVFGSPEKIERRELFAKAAKLLAGSVGGFALLSMAKIDSALGAGEDASTRKSVRRQITRRLARELGDKAAVGQFVASVEAEAALQCECACKCACICECNCACPCACDDGCDCNCTCACKWAQCRCACNCECTPPQRASLTRTIGNQAAQSKRLQGRQAVTTNIKTTAKDQVRQTKQLATKTVTRDSTGNQNRDVNKAPVTHSADEQGTAAPHANLQKVVQGKNRTRVAPGALGEIATSDGPAAAWRALKDKLTQQRRGAS